ncbi:hypothetical protein QQS21_000843 [Conoideocrella luteorostrata]|uniref:CENP-V/GFA domain-containing protein n=1 Tax=Conoideocrella luteorostrata TaxID=1105319 RepID=A0AAJ0D0I0_9HYPO|nr:hypothetical protein QQS21_000843 [Conoideocrella luteorostrata]
MTGIKPTRQPVTGSCHCGAIKYVAFLTLPHPYNESNVPSWSDQRIYRCNCTVCHKLGYLHVSVADKTNDFLLLSPTNPLEELGDYRINNKAVHWWYCKRCAVRCFAFMGRGELVELDLAALGVPGYVTPECGNNKTKVWRAARDGGHPEYGTYLNFNGHTVDATSQAFDMKALHEQGCIQYFDFKREEAEQSPVQFGKPHQGGGY